MTSPDQTPHPPTQLQRAESGDACIYAAIMRSRSSTTPHLPSYFLHLTSNIIRLPSIQLFHHQSYGHTFPIPNEPSKPEVHQIPSHPAMICIELSHSFSLLQCSMVSPSISILSRMSRYYRDHYSYWFFLLYCSVISRSFLNFSTLSIFIFPAFIALRFAFSQFKWSCSSILCRDEFRLLVSINVTTSIYFTIHRSSCVITFPFLFGYHTLSFHSQQFIESIFECFGELHIKAFSSCILEKKLIEGYCIQDVFTFLECQIFIHHLI